MARLTLYRIVHTDPPTEHDFLSKMMLGFRSRKEEHDRPELWTGLSMYDSMAAARATAQDFPVLGAYIAAVDIDHVDSRLVVARQTLRPGHYTVWAAPEALRAAVVAVAPA